MIAHRIAYLVSEGIADPGDIVAVTFTNKAAEEMRTRVEALLERDCRAMWISTFHAMCARILRREAPHIGLSRDFTIYDSADQQAVIKQLLREYQLDDALYQPRTVLSRISHAKNRMEGADTIGSDWNPRDKDMRRLFEGYQKALRDASAVDFDDLLLKIVHLFDEVSAVRDRYARRFRFVMVDEYQDTNRPQYLLIKQLAGVHRNLAVVGDPDQSIYKWRGADLRNILDFEQDFPEAEIVRLEQNYRSTEIILSAASAVIANNKNRKEKTLWTDRKGGEKIRYFRAADEVEEADYVARIAREALSEDVKSTMGVLYRTNAQSRAIEDSLRASGIAYVVFGGVGFYERREIKDALAYSEAHPEPARRHRAAARDQRADARHRQRRAGRPRARRSRNRVDRSAAAAGWSAADRRGQLAVVEARDRGRRKAAHPPASRFALSVSRSAGGIDRGGSDRLGFDRARQNPRPVRLPS